MLKNYISENISFLVKKMNCSQDEFGALFDLNRGNISQYVKEKSQPKIETIQKICNHFEILIDDFVNRPLSEIGNVANETKPSYGSEKEILAAKEEIIKSKEEIIQLQKNEIGRLKEKIEILSKPDNSKTA